MIPSVLPNSLITTANLSLVLLNTSSTFFADRLSGTSCAGCAMLRKSNPRSLLPIIRIISLTDTTPTIWSRSSSTSKYLLKCSSFMVSSTSSGVSLTCSAITSRRGVMRSLARLSEKRNTSRNISFSSWSITPCSELWLRIIFNSSCVICRSSGFMPINLLTNLVDALNKHTNGYAITEIICITPLNLAAYLSGSDRAMDLGTNSPTTIDKYVMTITTVARARCPAYTALTPGIMAYSGAMSSAMLIPPYAPDTIPIKVIPIWIVDKNFSDSSRCFITLFAFLLPLSANVSKRTLLDDTKAISYIAKTPLRSNNNRIIINSI